MKNLFLFLLFLFSSEFVNAQLSSVVKRGFSVSGNLENDYFVCEYGDTVTIHAFKKKSGKYYFALSTEDFAKIISFDDIPFDISEKHLKKLPNALDSDISSSIKTKNNEIITSKKNRIKQDALSGKIHFVVTEDNLFTPETGAHGSISKGDTIYILGYSNYYGTHRYALFSSKAFGIFNVIGRNNILHHDIDIKYLPTLTDNDVKIFLQQKELVEKQKQDELKAQYRKDALSGKVKAVISGSFYSEDYEKSPFSYGDTVSVLGYSYINYKHYFALCSEDGYGVFYTSLPSKSFKNSSQLKTKFLPLVDSPEVIEAMEKQKHIIDSIGKIKLAESVKKLNKSMQNLIQIYKENDPILITDVTWSSNSVGGIEVELEVINCSQQTIKYITFNGYFKNAVGDRCRNEIGGSSTWTGKGVGPIGPRPTSIENFDKRFDECRGAYDFDNLTFYSRVAHSFTLSSVTIQYMNGKTITLSGQKLSNHVRYRNPL